MQNRRVWGSALLFILAFHVHPHRLDAQVGPVVVIAEGLLKEAGRAVINWAVSKGMDKLASRRLDGRLADAEGQLNRAARQDPNNALMLRQLLRQVSEQRQILRLLTATQQKDSVFIANILGRQRTLLQDNNRLLQANNTLLQSIKSEQTESFANVIIELENIRGLVAAAVEKQGPRTTIAATESSNARRQMSTEPMLNASFENDFIRVRVDAASVAPDGRRASLTISVENKNTSEEFIARNGQSVRLADSNAGSWYLDESGTAGLQENSPCGPACWRETKYTRIAPGSRQTVVLQFRNKDTTTSRPSTISFTMECDRRRAGPAENAAWGEYHSEMFTVGVSNIPIR